MTRCLQADRSILLIGVLLASCGPPRSPEDPPAAVDATSAAASDPVAPALNPPPEPPSPRWVSLFDGESSDSLVVTPFGGEGEVWLKEGRLILEPGMLLTGVCWPDLELPPAYELEVTAARLSGTDFFCALTLPIGEDGEEYGTVVLGGWGGAITGLSCIDGLDASDNETRSFQDYVAGREYTLLVRVDRVAVSAALDGEPLFAVWRAGRHFSLRPEVSLSRPVGIASYATRAAITRVRWRAVQDGGFGSPADSGAAGLRPSAR